MHMQQSSGALLDGSENSQAEDMFPSTTSVHQKEKITEMVQSLSKDFNVFKQQNCHIGIGGAPRAKHMRQHIMGRSGNDYMNNDGSFARRGDSTQNSNDMSMD